MKRFHVHLAVADLAANIRFYSQLFGAAPTVEKEDYAKIFMAKRNLSLTYESNHYLEIMDATTTLQNRSNVWNADITF